MSSRKELFEIRESKILQTAEQLILESGEGDLTLDSLAQHLDLAKGTLYKHFASKDELLLRILIHDERKLFTQVRMMTALMMSKKTCRERLPQQWKSATKTLPAKGMLTKRIF